MVLSSAMMIALALVQGGASKMEKRTVTKSSVQLVKEPSFLAAAASRAIPRGEKIDVNVPAERGWFNARYGGSSGYIHLTYLSDRAIAFKVSKADITSDTRVSGNYNLAVGGFTEGVETNYRKSHPDVEKGFKLLEPFMPARPTRGAMVPDPDGLSHFVNEGHLKVPQGAAP